jgi:hypothetical protein
MEEGGQVGKEEANQRREFENVGLMTWHVH